VIFLALANSSLKGIRINAAPGIGHEIGMSDELSTSKWCVFLTQLTQLSASFFMAGKYPLTMVRPYAYHPLAKYKGAESARRFIHAIVWVP
jgi:hypothetical protein